MRGSRTGKLIRVAAIVTVAGLLAGFVLEVRELAGEPLQELAAPPGPAPLAAQPAPAGDATAAPASPPRVPFAFTSNAQCRDCHQEIWDECAGDQHAQAWF